MPMQRRHFITQPALLAAAGLLPAAAAQANAAADKPAAPAINPGRPMAMPKGKQPRVVICGGGWGGLTAARHLRKLAPGAEVVVLDRNPTFWSGPMSNKWLVDVVNTDFINHDLLRPARTYGYTLLQTEVNGFDRDKRQVSTAHGWIDYDYLILSGGIRDAFNLWFGDDQRAITHTIQHFGSAYIPNRQMFSLKQRVHSFKGGTIVMTLPPPPHRCPPSPYERACLMAWLFKKNKIPAKIIILDPKAHVAPIRGGYEQAFKELYADIITHVPNAHVQEVDPFNKRIKTAAGDFKFDEAIFMPPHQAADMVWQAGLIGQDAKGKPTGWADMHPRLFHANSDDRVYFVGDLMGPISDHFGHYPKSAHVAHFIGKIVAGYLAQRLEGKPVTPMLPDNLCYMMVNADPQEAISVLFDYEVEASGRVIQNQVDVDVRSPDLVKEDFEWIRERFADFLAI